MDAQNVICWKQSASALIFVIWYIMTIMKGGNSMSLISILSPTVQSKLPQHSWGWWMTDDMVIVGDNKRRDPSRDCFYLRGFVFSPSSHLLSFHVMPVDQQSPRWSHNLGIQFSTPFLVIISLNFTVLLKTTSRRPVVDGVFTVGEINVGSAIEVTADLFTRRSVSASLKDRQSRAVCITKEK